MQPTEQLTEEHRRIRVLLDRCTQARGDARAQLVRAAAAELRRHFRLEEELFYPVLSRLRDEAAHAAVREALEQHHSVDGLLVQLEALEPEDAAFSECATRVSAAFDAHVSHEEDAVFVGAFARLAPRRLEKLASQMNSRRRQASLTQRNFEKT